MKKIAFIMHGKLKHRNKICAELEEVFNNHYETVFCATEYADHGIELTYNAIVQGTEYVICVGGDGTMNQVANGIMKAANENPQLHIKAGLLPHGTGNDFAKTIGVTYNLHKLKQFIDNGLYKPVDLGLVNYTSPAGSDESRYFVNITDVGIGGTIAQKLVTASKAWGPTITYQKAILTTLLTYRKQEINITAGNFTYTGKALNFIIANGKYFGGGLGIAPHATANDGLFALVVAGNISILDYLLNLGQVRQCKPIDHPQLQYLSASRVAVNGPVPMPIDMDGEFIGFSPMNVAVVPGAINMLGAL
jgi:YegS/Rv2252/BmrU family lipid kinase